MACVRLEDGTVGCTNQITVLIFQELVRCPVQRASLMGADVDPGSNAVIVSSGDQESELAIDLRIEFDKLAFGDLFRAAKELAGTHVVCL